MARVRRIRDERRRIGKQVSMSRQDWEKADSVADSLGMTRSEMMRTALSQFYENIPERGRAKDGTGVLR